MVKDRRQSMPVANGTLGRTAHGIALKQIKRKPFDVSSRAQVTALCGEQVSAVTGPSGLESALEKRAYDPIQTSPASKLMSQTMQAGSAINSAADAMQLTDRFAADEIELPAAMAGTLSPSRRKTLVAPEPSVVYANGFSMQSNEALRQRRATTQLQGKSTNQKIADVLKRTQLDSEQKRELLQKVGLNRLNNSRDLKALLQAQAEDALARTEKKRRDASLE